MNGHEYNARLAWVRTVLNPAGFYADFLGKYGSCDLDAELDNPYRITEIERLEREPRYALDAIQGLNVYVHGSCQSGTIRVMSDVWENCRGCANCLRPCWCAEQLQNNWQTCPTCRGTLLGTRMHVAHAVGVALWRAAVRQEHTRLAAALDGLGALAAIGQAVRAALSPGLGLGHMAQGFVAAWKIPTVGGTYEVTGRRGRAARVFGETGELLAIQTEEAVGYGRRATQVFKLRTLDGRHVYAPAGQCTRRPTPQAQLEHAARRALLPARATDATRGEVVYTLEDVRSKEHGVLPAGTRVVLFWLGDGGRRGVHLDTAPRRAQQKAKDRTAPVWWCTVEQLSRTLPIFDLNTEGGVQAEILVRAFQTIVEIGLAQAVRNEEQFLAAGVAAAESLVHKDGRPCTAGAKCRRWHRPAKVEMVTERGEAEACVHGVHSAHCLRCAALRGTA